MRWADRARRRAPLVAAVAAVLLMVPVLPAVAQAPPPGPPGAPPASTAPPAPTTPGGPPAQPVQVAALAAAKQSRTPAEKKIDSKLLAALKQQEGQPAAVTAPGAPVVLQTGITTDPAGRALVDVAGGGGVAAAVTGVGGIVVVPPTAGPLRAAVPLGGLRALAASPEVTSIAPAAGASTGGLRRQLSSGIAAAAGTGGSPVSEGDVTHGAAGVRNALGADGSGVKVGVLSDGVASLAASQSSGNLGPVTVLPGQAGASGDEGTAMLEIVHDVAPGAQLLFATAFTSPSSFAQNIRALRAAGAQVIVDDVFYYNEPALQDGPIAQAVNDVTAQGAVYLSSAGNNGNLDDGTSSTWEGDFRSSPTAAGGGAAHDFDPGPGVTVTDAIAGPTVASPATIWWSDPLKASANDYDLYLVDGAGNVVASSTNDQTGTQDPAETVNVPAGRSDLRLEIVKFAGADRFVHLSTNDNRLASFATAGQVIGHASARDAISVAATPAARGVQGGPTGPYPGPFTAGARTEPFSSDGPRRIFFSPTGAALTPGNFSSTGGQVLQDPDLTAADGVSTSVNGYRPFFGTSAAAPHAGAIAAQVLGARPTLNGAQVKSALLAGTLDAEAPGVDRDTGHGVVMSDPSVRPAAPTGPSYRPVNQVRLQDTRSSGTTTDGLAQGGVAYGPGETRNLLVTGRGNVPADASAVALTITVVSPTAAGYVTAFPTGSARPNASNLNFAAAQTVTSSVIAKVGSGGQVSLYNYVGSAQVLVDVSGYFGPAPTAFTSLAPARLLETRSGSSIYRTVDGQFQGTGPLRPGESRDLVVTGRGGVPAAGVDAVALTVTATEPTAFAYLTAFPTGAPRPLASNLNYVPGQTVPNLVLVKVGANGRITMFNNTGTTQVIADVAGWFPSASAFHGLPPARLFETRADQTTVDGQFAGGGALAPGQTRTFTVAGRGGVPATAGAVVLNLTTTASTGAGALTAFPAGAPVPGTADLSFQAGQTIANEVVTRVGANGQVAVTNTSGSPQVIADVAGWFDPT